MDNRKDAELSLSPGERPRERVLVIAGTISGSDVATLCETLVRMLEDDNAGPVVCDVGAMCRADLAAVDGLARIQLAAGSRGRRIRLRAPSAELRELIALVGLGDVLP